MSVTLSIKTGPDKGKRFSLYKTNFVIGRDRSIDIPINDTTVSRHHCRIRIVDDEIRIADLQSKNKTTINGVCIENEQVINENDKIKIGETVFCVTYEKDITYSNQPHAQTRPLNLAMVAHHVKTSIINDDTVSIDKIAGDLELMYRVNSAIQSIRDPNELIKTLLELIFEVIPADRGAILLYDTAEQKLIPNISLSREEEGNTDICISQSIVNQVFNEKIALLTKDAMADPRFMDKQTIIKNNIRSAMCVPMGTFNKMIGVIHLDTRIQSGMFTEKDLNLLSAIANQAATALENIKFYQRLYETNKQLQQTIQKDFNIIGNSVHIKKIFHLIERLSQTDTTILIQGESGTGKELVARAIHYTSMRKDKQFVCVNCAALNKNLLESEIFGHEKGAFTGAVSQKKGYFEAANGGTIFLDEIGELSLESQVKLLRVIEEGKFERVGGTQKISTDLRILAATNKSLDKLVEEKLFREDLYYRLNVIQIDIAPLRERKADIMPLALFFLEKYRKKVVREILRFSPEAEEILKTYHWPGNVRELKNAIERAVVLGSSNMILPEDLPIDLSSRETKSHADGFPTLMQIEREHILHALNHTGWNKKQTAQYLGIQRSTLYEKLKTYHITL